jgi:hypothetical protein
MFLHDLLHVLAVAHGDLLRPGKGGYEHIGDTFDNQSKSVFRVVLSK